MNSTSKQNLMVIFTDIMVLNTSEHKAGECTDELLHAIH